MFSRRYPTRVLSLGSSTWTCSAHFWKLLWLALCFARNWWRLKTVCHIYLLLRRKSEDALTSLSRYAGPINWVFIAIRSALPFLVLLNEAMVNAYARLESPSQATRSWWHCWCKKAGDYGSVCGKFLWQPSHVQLSKAGYWPELEALQALSQSPNISNQLDI